MATGKRSSTPVGDSSYEKAWDITDPASVLTPVEEPREQYVPATHADALRHAIASDPARHGQWFQLSQYRPMPRRTALTTARGWRNASPGKFGGDRRFDARIMPVDDDGHGCRDLTITKATMFAVAIRYPMGDTERDYDAASDRHANQDTPVHPTGPALTGEDAATAGRELFDTDGSGE